MKAHSKPWIVSLHLEYVSENTLYCAGTLIGSKVVLTAAHCICQCAKDEPRGLSCGPLEVSPNCSQWRRMYVIAGNHNTVKYDEGEQNLRINDAKVHSKYNGTKSI